MLPSQHLALAIGHPLIIWVGKQDMRVFCHTRYNLLGISEMFEIALQENRNNEGRVYIKACQKPIKKKKKNSLVIT